jgi:hypothetical protein
MILILQHTQASHATHLSSDFMAMDNRTSEHSSTLSSHIWRLKDNNDNYDVKWNIVGTAGQVNLTL